MRKSIQVPRSKGFNIMRVVTLLFFLSVSLSLPFDANAKPLDIAGTYKIMAQVAPTSPPVQSQEVKPALPAPSAPGAPFPPDTVAVKTVQEALLKENFSYAPKSLLDPFIAFIAPADSTPPPIASDDEDMGPPPEPQRPLTPLQKMKISEVEKGLKAITWGDLGRKAIIEDAAGKGYIVGVGTPVGERNGVVTEIFNDHLVIQQEYWDKKAKRMVPQNFVVKLVKVKN